MLRGYDIRVFSLPRIMSSTLLAAAVLTGAAPASASSLSSVAAPAFYDAASLTPSTPGTVERTKVDGSVTRFLYTTSREDGTPVIASGTLFEPTATWHGQGEAPTVVLAPGTRGMAPECAASRGPGMWGAINPQTLAVNVNYERPFYSRFTGRGMRLVVPDYIGLGVGGPHTYMNRREQGQAVLDSARAAAQITGAQAPVGLFGYSQGGGAAAAAAELAAEYAPELRIAGTYAGAVPADLVSVLSGTGAQRLGPTLAFAISGLSVGDAEFAAAIDDNLTDAGREWLEENSTSCVVDAMIRWNGQPLERFLAEGRTLEGIISSDPRISERLAAQKLGATAPTGPVLIGSVPNDDTIPHGQVMQLAADYQALGASVEVLNNPIHGLSSLVPATHIMGLLTQFGPALDWLDARLASSATPAS